MSAAPVIEVRNLVKRFGEQTVLDGVNLSVYPGETMVIMGGSGSGKIDAAAHHDRLDHARIGRRDPVREESQHAG
jgi:glutamine transport system ATP-binding protein